MAYGGIHKVRTLLGGEEGSLKNVRKRTVGEEGSILKRTYVFKFLKNEK